MQTNKRFLKECEKTDKLLSIFDQVMRCGIDNTAVHIAKSDDSYSTLGDYFGVVDKTKNSLVKRGVYIYDSTDVDAELRNEATSTHVTDCDCEILFYEI
jgi:hypothetical protein